MKRIAKALSALAALALFGAVARAQTATTNTLALTTFGPETVPGWGYDYFYGNNGLGLKSYNRSFYLPEDTDLTNGMFQLTFDATDLLDTLNWGVGTGGPLFTQDPSFTSGDRADYILSFDARVEGLLEGQASANGQFEFRIDVLDNDGITKRFQVNVGFQPTGEWKNFRYSLQDGGLATGGTNPQNIGDTEFEQLHANFKELQFNVNFHEPFRQFGYDSGNAFYLDNVKLEIINRAPAVVKPTATATVLEWNMDDKPIAYEYNYKWSEKPENQPIFTATRADNTLGVGETVGWALQFDNTSFAENTPAWAGGGTGGGGPTDYTLLSSGDLADYRIIFDAKALGLQEGRTGSGVVQIHMDAPDDTVTPADENTTADFIIRLDVPINGLTAEFKSFTNSFSKATVGSGTRELFAQYSAAITGLRTQWQIENAADFNVWGYDADNALVVDNIKIERIVVDTLPITVTREGNEIVLSWIAPATGTTVLQTATSVTGPYTDVANATSPYRSTITGDRFFRLYWTPPAGQ